MSIAVVPQPNLVNNLLHQQYHERPSQHADPGPAAAAAASTMASIPNLLLKHARSTSLEKQQQQAPSLSASSSHAQSSVNGHASTSQPPLHAQLAAGSSSANGVGSFVRNGDIVYDQGPPPAAPLPAVGTRSYTVLKEVGDGSFGTVWLADWHSPLSLPKGTGPPGPSSRPEYRGKRLVALKRMKKAFEGGWDECMKLKELKSLRSIPLHPNIIPLYDAFLLPTSKELYFVFECMEGNLYQLTKSRKGRPLAAGLVADLFRQMLSGLDHIHSAGYFHRDMKPENLLITTTGLADYPCFQAPGHAPHQRPPEKDVVAIVKIADFGLARETRSRPPYTEYVSTRWYRAPEVLLRSRDYSNPVDMWALGTILAEMVNLKPLFPGQSEVDQVFRICEVMGDPSSDYGHDERGRVLGGGNWERGIKMAKSVGFQFPKIQPIRFQALFDGNLVPSQLVDLMQDLMRYDPKARLTTIQCLESPYFSIVAPKLLAVPVPSVPNHVRQAQQAAQVTPKAQSSATLPNAPGSPYSIGSAVPSPRVVPSSHSNQSQYAKPAFDPSASAGPGLPPPASGYTGTTAAHSDGYHRYSDLHSSASSTAADSPDLALQRDRHLSLAQSMMSNDSAGLGGVHVTVSTGSQVGSPAMGYPESVIGDVNMEGAEDQSYASVYQQPRSVSPAASSVHSFGAQEPSASLPLPHPHVYHGGHPHRQGANGYAPSTHSSYYNPSMYSGYSNGSGGRRGSAGGASTFYDGSIFEGIAPTRAASILSFPASYGERPPSPKFSQAQLPLPSTGYARSTHSLPVNPALAALRQSGGAGGFSSHRADSDNYTVDFEREALQRSQNQSTSSLPRDPSAHMPKSDSAESVKASGRQKDGKSGRGWMASVFHSSSDQRPVHHHPQQQPLIHPANFPASSSSASLAGTSTYAPSTTNSLKRSPSERSTHGPEQPPPQPAVPLDPKKAKKEAERLAKEAEKAKRDAAQKAARDRARAVMQKRNALAQAADPLHNFGQHQFPTKTSSTSAAANGRTGPNGQQLSDKERQARDRAILEARKQQAAMMAAKLPQISEDGKMRPPPQPLYNVHSYGSDGRYKARRRDDDDDVHSMSSNETRSERRFSISSHATGSTVSTTNTMDSDPGPSRSRAAQLLPPVRRTPSVSSFGGQSIQSQSSGHSGYARRDLNTGSSNTSSLEHGLVGRFQGLTAAERAVSPDGRGSPAGLPGSSVSPMQSPSGVPGAPGYYTGHPGVGHQSHAISLPPIQSFDHPPPKDFHFGSTPRTSHSSQSNGSTISGNSQFPPNASHSQPPQGLPFTQEMYQHQLQQQQQQQQQQR